jgi:Fe-S-cluster containining protein
MSSPLQGYQVDLGELDGRRFQCLDDCGLCCLCQPELLEVELPYFKRNHPDRVVAKRQPHKHFALAMKKKVGSCTFLDHRRCSVYNMRPHYCRQFPFHVHVGDRVQVELDLSCRGVWSGKGEDATAAGVHILKENEKAIASTFQLTYPLYRQFFRNCLDMQIECRPDQMRKEAVPVMDHLNDLSYLATVLEASAEEEVLDVGPLRAKPLDKMKRRELEEAAWEAVKDSLGVPDPFDAPIYCDDKGQWNLFRLEDEDILHNIITEEGDLERRGALDADDVQLPELTSDGAKVFGEYMQMLNRRDSLIGNAFYLMDDYGYEDEMTNIYIGVLATSALDLLWRIALVAKVTGNIPDARGVVEGIIFYDMDRLDAPTIGAFL